MSDPDARAEAALRDALARRADDVDTVPLPTPTGRRRPWVVVAAAAAAAVLIGGVGLLALPDDDAPSPPASAPSGVPPDDVRTVVYRDVAVDVPATWDDEATPNDNGCGFPARPFVALANRTQVFQLKLCTVPGPAAPEGFPTVAVEDWVPNLRLTDAGDYTRPETDGARTYRGWTLTRRTVGAAVLVLLTEADSERVADSILASVRRVEADRSGCPTTSPVQAEGFARPTPPSDLAAVDGVESLAVCLYDRVGADRPGLAASRVLGGGEATAVLRAVRSAPAGGGPDTDRCLATEEGETALVLRFGLATGGIAEVYVYSESCFGNGFDDGTTRRALTADACRPLWGGTVQQFSGSSAPYRVCHG